MTSSKLRVVPLVLALGLLATMIPGASARSSSSGGTTATATESYAIATTVSLTYKAKRTDFVGYVDMVAADLSEDEGGCVTLERYVRLFKIVDGDPVKRGATTADEGGFYKFAFSKAQKGKWEVRVSGLTFADRYANLVKCSGAKDSLKI